MRTTDTPTQNFTSSVAPATSNRQTANLPRMSKQWKIANKKSGQYTQKTFNRSIEGNFQRLVATAKRLLKPFHKVALEKDQREDKSDSFAMHCFVTETLFLRLECDIQSNYQVQFAFSNCPVDGHLMALLNTYPLKERATRISLAPDLPTFYSNAVAYQGDKHLIEL